MTGAVLHLVHPLGFSLDDRYLKRAGLDYWSHLHVVEHPDLSRFLDSAPVDRVFPASKWGRQVYSEVDYPDDAYLVFGKESAGLPRDLVAAHEPRSLRIPLLPGQRSLNLSNAVAIIVFEVLRRRGFPGLERSLP